MTEKFRVNGTLRNRTAVYRKILCVFPPAELVDYLRDIVFSDSAFTCHKDRKVCRSHSYSHLQSPVQGRIVTDYVVLVFKFL